MTNLTRWEPVREMMTLREAMDRLFDDAFTSPVRPSAAAIVPAIDLYETANEVVAKVNLPGMKTDDVEISVSADILTLRGEMKASNEKKEANYHIFERRVGAFERSVRLPTEVQTDKAKADFEDGVLTITLPKSEEVKPRVINIKAK
jgi:HSP20 family protein